MTEDIHSISSLPALGDLLRTTREAHALTLDEAEAQTRIRRKYLEALEQGDFSVLPSLTHAKGFLRNYAGYLQLDAMALIDRFAMLTGENVSSVTTTTTPPREGAPPRPTGDTGSHPQAEQPPYPPAPTGPPSPYPPRPATYVTPRDRVGPSGPTGLSGQAPPPEARPNPNAAYPPTPVQPYQVPVVEAPTSAQPKKFWQTNLFTIAILLVGFAVIIWWTTTQLSQISVDDIVPTEQVSEVLEELSADSTLTATPTFRPTSTSPPAGGPQIVDRVLLTISVEQPSWTRIVVDGEVVFEEQAEPGTTLQFEGQEEIVLLTGNGAALDVTYNGQPLGLLGERGEVVERVFLTGGFVTPTPTPTVTTTPTSVPSPTPRDGATTGTPEPDEDEDN